ncbi:MAG: sodium:proton antiporter [Alphaproteobacteria bacterium]
MLHTDTFFLNLYWAIPFVGLLLSLAFWPLFSLSFWHKHYGKIIFLWSASFLLPSFLLGGYPTAREVVHILLLEYTPFMILIASLFIITSGIRIHVSWAGNPLSNIGILFLGTLLSSCIGTTGASMLLVRPLLRANAWRRYQAHVFIFFIFLVANIGGALTPLGDPPLFIGFLEGVPFFWPIKHLMGPTFLVVTLILCVFFAIDLFFHKKEDLAPPSIDIKNPFKINGTINLVLLGGVVVAVLASGQIKTGISYNVAGSTLTLENIARDFFLLGICFLSLKLTPKRIRDENHFTWDPLLEVSKVFLGIFITVVPVIIMLKAGASGPFKGILSIVNAGGTPNNALYFWLSGICSSFLDNAPTYLVFFFTAGGDVGQLTTTLYKTLMAISMGSVYLGALTYIGNAPNFMVRSIVEHQGVKMPNFFLYMLIACVILVPIFLISTYIYL